MAQRKTKKRIRPRRDWAREERDETSSSGNDIAVPAIKIITINIAINDPFVDTNISPGLL